MRSRRSPATRRVTASGYMQMRWYQQSGQGWKWATSDRYRLPSIVPRATTNAIHIELARMSSNRYPALESGFLRWSTASTITMSVAAQTISDRTAKNRTTVAVLMDTSSVARGVVCRSGGTGGARTGCTYPNCVEDM